MLGAYIFAGTFERALGLSHWLSIVLTIVCMMAFGVLVATIVLNPLRNLQFVTYAMFGTMMLSRIVLEIIRLTWGTLPFTVKGFLRSSVNIGSTVLSESYLYIIGVSIIIVVALQLFFKKTKAGKAMICVSQNKDAAALMGINVKASINLTVALSAALCGVIGILCAPLYNVNTSMVASVALKGFCAASSAALAATPARSSAAFSSALWSSSASSFCPPCTRTYSPRSDDRLPAHPAQWHHQGEKGVIANARKE